MKKFCALLVCLILFSGCGQASPVLTASPLTTPTPTPSPSPFPVAAQCPTIAAGRNGFALAVKADGSLWAWGTNDFDFGGGGEAGLGDGTANSSLVPVKIMDSAKTVAAGYDFALAVKTDGSLWAWGFNDEGQLGDGTTDSRLVPVKIMDSVQSAAADEDTAFAVKTDGSLWAWGFSYDTLPKKIMDDAAYVACGGAQTLVVKTDGTLWLWSWNADAPPEKIMDGVMSASASQSGVFAVKADGTLWAWGGQYGNSPEEILSGVASADSASGAVITNDGELYILSGNNSKTKLMDSVTEVSSDAGVTLAVGADGSLWSWGNNRYGQLGFEVNVNGQTLVYTGTDTPMKVMDGMSASPRALPPTAPVDTPAPLPDDVSITIPPACEPYAAVLNAYALLVRSGFRVYDPNLISGSLLTWQFMQSPIQYALYDLNGDGSPELLISVSDINEIAAIYTYHDGKVVPLIYAEGRDRLSLTVGEDGGCVIGEHWGHMGHAEDFYYALDADGNFITLNKLYTNGDVRDPDTNEFIGHYRAKDVNGEQVDITEEEYCALMQKYGDYGYEALLDIGTPRLIKDIEWSELFGGND